MKLLKSKKEYGIILLFLLLLVFPLFKMEYATDTYTIQQVGLKAFGDSMVSNGRLVTAVFFYLFDKLSIGVTGFYYASFILSIVCMSVAIYRMYKIVQGRMGYLLSLFVAVLVVLNPLAVEYFLFIEKGFFAFAILMTVISCEGFVAFLRSRSIKGLVIAYLTLMLASFTYQSIPGAFVTLSVVFIVIYSKSKKELIINNLVAASVYGFGVALDFVFLKLFGGSRISGGIHLSNLKKVAFLLGWQTIFIYLGIIAILFLICALISKSRTGAAFSKACQVSFIKCIYAFAAALLVVYLPFLFTSPSEVWLMFRIAYPLGVLIGAYVVLFCYHKEGISSNGTKRPSKAGLISIVVVLFVELVFFHTMIFGRLINNSTDEALCHQIGEIIEEYEKESGTEIKYVKIYYDVKIEKRNPGVLKIGDCNARAFSKPWSDVSHMNAILERSFIRLDGDVSIYQTYFANKSWDSFSEDQLVFENETLHICVY